MQNRSQSFAHKAKPTTHKHDFLANPRLMLKLVNSLHLRAELSRKRGSYFSISKAPPDVIAAILIASSG